MPDRFLRKILCSNMLRSHADSGGPGDQDYVAPRRGQREKTLVSRWRGDCRRGDKARSGSEHEVNYYAHTAGELSVLQLTPEAEGLTRALLATGALPARAQTDAAHLAIAAAAQADYLLTWNCRHLANAQILRRLEAEAKRAGWKLPKVCTPPELMGDFAYETESDS